MDCELEALGLQLGTLFSANPATAGKGQRLEQREGQDGTDELNRREAELLYFPSPRSTRP